MSWSKYVNLYIQFATSRSEAGATRVTVQPLKSHSRQPDNNDVFFAYFNPNRRVLRLANRSEPAQCRNVEDLFLAEMTSIKPLMWVDATKQGISATKGEGVCPAPTQQIVFQEYVRAVKSKFEDAEQDTLTNPSLIIEVLSDSTERYDRGDKFAHYRRLTG